MTAENTDRVDVYGAVEVVDQIKPPAPDLLYGKWTHDELREAWALVRPAGDWKGPIDATLPGTVDQGVIDDAVLFFTGSPTTWQPSRRRAGYMRVTAAGYYACIGS